MSGDGVTMDETTGVHPVPPPGYPPPQPMQPVLTRDLWVKILFSLVPIVFTAGALFVSVQAMTGRQDEQERALKVEQDRGVRLETEQRLTQATVQSLSVQQDKMMTKVESIDEKLNEQRSQLSAIGERVGARPMASARSASFRDRMLLGSAQDD